MAGNNQAVNTGLSAVKAQEPTREWLLAEIKRLTDLQSQPQGLVIRINEFAKDDKGNIMRDDKGNPLAGKGTIAVYGLGRFPTSLYAEQWERLLAPENVKAILTLCKSPKASRKVRNAEGAANGAVTGSNAQQSASDAATGTPAVAAANVAA